MKRRRVKITGLGFVTPAGIGKEEFLRNIQEGVSRVVLLNRFPGEAGAFVGAEVKGFKSERQLEGLNSKRMPRHTQFAVVAAGLALARGPPFATGPRTPGNSRRALPLRQR